MKARSSFASRSSPLSSCSGSAPISRRSRRSASCACVSSSPRCVNGCSAVAGTLASWRSRVSYSENRCPLFRDMRGLLRAQGRSCHLAAQSMRFGMAFKERVFSGVQPTGNLHLGNYLGAIVKFVALQANYDCIYCVVDMHAITVWQDPAELPKATREVTAAFLACGIDAKKHIVFNQSQVAEHAELAWVFNCVARIGWLNRMTQFKEKAGKDRENASVGLYVYPNLMAADILVYRATHVPVGEDQ